MTGLCDDVRSVKQDVGALKESLSKLAMKVGLIIGFIVFVAGKAFDYLPELLKLLGG